MPQECPPGEGTGQAPRQRCRCPQVKRAVGTEAVSATGIWAGRQQYLPQLGKKYDFPSRQRRKRMEAGGRGLGGGTATHSHMRGLILQLLPLPGSPPALPPFYPLSLSGVPIRSRGQAGFAAGHQQETQQRHTLGPCSHPAVLL